MKVYLSSMVFKNQIEEAIEICKREKFNLEFSSGIPYRNDLKKLMLKSDLVKITHNYFPAPKSNFTLNLSSIDESIRRKSIQHCKLNIDLAEKINSNYYSFHSGFCVDPKPNLLGKLIKKVPFDRDLHIELFVKSLKELLDYAKLKNIKLCVENNVINFKNFYENENENIFLMCESDEILKIFEMVNDDYLRLLLDTGHLKVSANTLKRNIYEETKKIISKVELIHHSENNGIEDQNLPLDENYWFLNFKNIFKKFDHVIEVKNLEIDQIKKQLSLIYEI